MKKIDISEGMKQKILKKQHKLCALGADTNPLKFYLIDETTKITEDNIIAVCDICIDTLHMDKKNAKKNNL